MVGRKRTRMKPPWKFLDYIYGYADNKFCLAGFCLISKQQLGNYSEVIPHVVLGSLGLTRQAELTLSSDSQELMAQ